MKRAILILFALVTLVSGAEAFEILDSEAVDRLFEIELNGTLSTMSIHHA